jgi:hypothetical protein
VGNDEEYDNLRQTLVAYGNQLRVDAERFYQYAALHFDKDDPDSWAKGEVNWRQYLDICHTLGTEHQPKPTGGSKAAKEIISAEPHTLFDFADEIDTLTKNMSGDLIDYLRKMSGRMRTAGAARHKVEEVRKTVPSSPGLPDLCAKIACGLRQVAADWAATPSQAPLRRAFDFIDRINGYAAELEAAPVIDADQIIEAIGSAAGETYSAMALNYRRAAGMTEPSPFPSILQELQKLGQTMESHTRIGLPEYLRKLHIANWMGTVKRLAAEVEVATETKPELVDIWFEKAERHPSDVTIREVMETPPAFSSECKWDPTHYRKDDSLVERLDIAVLGLKDGRLPAPHDIYRAVKREGPGSGWSFECIGIGVSDLEAAVERLRDHQSGTVPRPPYVHVLGEYDGWALYVPEGMPSALRARLQDGMRTALHDGCSDLGRGLEP